MAHAAPTAGRNPKRVTRAKNANGHGNPKAYDKEKAMHYAPVQPHE